MRILPALILLLATPASAGGASWSFVVETFREVSSTEAVVVLHPERQGADFPESCRQLTVEIAFDREPFWQRTWSREQVSAATHSEALGKLRRAAAKRAPIRFGSMGSGLAPVASDPCVVRSRGLAILEEAGGEKAIFSFHDPL